MTPPNQEEEGIGGESGIGSKLNNGKHRELLR